MKQRLDLLLVARGLAASRTQAAALILEGRVRVAGQVETKASRQVGDEAAVEVEKPPRFVSRGGEKLEGAFALWEKPSSQQNQTSAVHLLSPSVFSVAGRVCLDVGSSTGGFTDCLLQHGAARVMAVDVGTNQLAYKLRTDPRVWVRENFNARYLKPADLPEVPSVAVTDVSFISLRLILPPIAEVLAPGGLIVALIKPQFEVGKGKAPGGLVRDEALRLAARDGIVDFARRELGLELLGLAESPILGKEMGNVEYLSFWRKPANGRNQGEEDMLQNHLMKLSLEDLGKVLCGNPHFQKAVAFLREHDLKALAPGRHEIDGDNCWANVSDAALTPAADEMTYEVHAKYIDIQSPIGGPETFGILDTPAGTPPVDPEKDYVLFRAKGRLVTLVPGEFAVFFPLDGAHAPQHATDGASSVRKIVLKVRTC